MKERRATDPANKTLRMPKAVQRRDVVLQNGSGTAATLWCKHVKVILPAKGLPILFMKAFMRITKQTGFNQNAEQKRPFLLL